ncbi:MAG: hypothetical protein WAZ40_02430 [Minisyncoccia bacterium]
MEFYPLVRGDQLPEVYHLGFNGTYFEILLNPTYWVQFVEICGEGTHFASNQGEKYTPPHINGGSFEQHGCASASNTLEGFTCIRIPAFLENQDNEEAGVSLRVLGHSLSNVLFVLQCILGKANERKEQVKEGQLTQLFVLQTYVADGQHFHGAGLELSLSPRARKYLEQMGEGVRLDDALDSMSEHYSYSSTSKGADGKVRLFRTAMDVRIRTNGVLHMHTVGNCACLGTMPKDFGDQGCSLSSHNVDMVSQQFNLLVGIASIWQMVREGLRNNGN